MTVLSCLGQIAPAGALKSIESGATLISSFSKWKVFEKIQVSNDQEKAHNPKKKTPKTEVGKN